MLGGVSEFHHGKMCPRSRSFKPSIWEVLLWVYVLQDLSLISNQAVQVILWMVQCQTIQHWWYFLSITATTLSRTGSNICSWLHRYANFFSPHLMSSITFDIAKRSLNNHNRIQESTNSIFNFQCKGLTNTTCIGSHSWQALKMSWQFVVNAICTSFLDSAQSFQVCFWQVGVMNLKGTFVLKPGGHHKSIDNFSEESLWVQAYS